jgi:hypothetical protein
MDLPIVAFELGAIAERLQTYTPACVLPLTTSAAGINDALMQTGQVTNTSHAKKEIAMDSNPIENQESVSEEIATSVELLTLPAGTYAFTVENGNSTTSSGEKVTLPALQVGIAPTNSPGAVEILESGTTSDRWLARRSDIVIVRISGESASLMLTSVRLPGTAPLAINVQRLVLEPGSDQIVEADGGAPDSRRRILVHIQNVGDVHFSEGWAGCVGETLWIEAFAIISAGTLPLESLEYCGVTADGYQTPWMSNQTLCGTRGQGMPMQGFAVRLTPEFTERYECTYRGKFLSGRTLGPFRNGDLCSSDIAGDPLRGIELYVAERSGSENKKPSAEVQYTNAA